MGEPIAHGFLLPHVQEETGTGVGACTGVREPA